MVDFDGCHIQIAEEAENYAVSEFLRRLRRFNHGLLVKAMELGPEEGAKFLIAEKPIDLHAAVDGSWDAVAEWMCIEVPEHHWGQIKDRTFASLVETIKLALTDKIANGTLIKTERVALPDIAVWDMHKQMEIASEHTPDQAMEALSPALRMALDFSIDAAVEVIRAKVPVANLIGFQMGATRADPDGSVTKAVQGAIDVILDRMEFTFDDALICMGYFGQHLDFNYDLLIDWTTDLCWSVIAGMLYVEAQRDAVSRLLTLV
jgi:hypothetical protein